MDHDQVISLIQNAKYREAMRVINNTSGDDLIGKGYMSLIHEKLGEFDKALQYSKEILENLDPKEKTLTLFMGQFTQAIVSIRLGDFNEAISQALLAEIDLTKIDKKNFDLFKYWHGKLLNLLGLAYWQIGDYDQSKIYHNKALNLRKEIKNDYEISLSYNNLGLVSWINGDINSALEYYTKSLDLISQYQDNLQKGLVLRNIGLVQRDKSNLKEAMEFYQKSLELLETTGNMTSISRTLHCIGEILVKQGELDVALNHFQKLLKINKEIGNPKDISWSLGLLGNIAHQKGQFELAQDFHKQSLEIIGPIGDIIDTANAIYSLILVCIDNKKMNEAKLYMENIKQLDPDDKNKFIRLYIKLFDALILKNSKRVSKKAEAQAILKEIIEEEIIDGGSTKHAMINLVDLLLDEYKAYREPEVLKEIEELSEKLYELAEMQNSYILLVETLQLRAKFATINQDIHRARKLLTQAEQIANEKRMIKLAKKISTEQDLILRSLGEWERIVESEHTSPNEELLKLSIQGIDSLIDEMKYRKPIEEPHITREQPVKLLIINKSGISIYSTDFKLYKKINDQLLSGMISAISDFGKEILTTSGNIERIMFQDFTIAMNFVDGFGFCYIFKGQSYYAISKLTKFISKVNNSEVWSEIFKSSKTGRMSNESVRLIHNIVRNIFEVKTH